MNVTLTPDLAAIIKAQMSSGRYSSRRAVVGEALRLLQTHHRTDAEKLQDLRREIALGLEQLERGEHIEFTEEVLEAIKRAGRQRQKAEVKSHLNHSR